MFVTVSLLQCSACFVTDVHFSLCEIEKMFALRLKFERRFLSHEINDHEHEQFKFSTRNICMHE